MILPLNSVNVDKHRYSYSKNNVPFLAKEKIFTQNLGFLKSKTGSAVSDIVTAYRDIASRLAGQSEGVLNEHSLNEFNPVKGLTFFDAGKPNLAFNITMPKHDESSKLLRIFLKNTETKKIEKCFFISNEYNVVKNTPPSTPEKIPSHLEFYNQEEINNLNLDNEINNILEIIDPLLLKLRRSLIDVKPVINNSTHEINRPAGSVNLSQVHSDINYRISTGGRPKINYSASAGILNKSSVNLIVTFSEKNDSIKKAFSSYSTTTGERIRRSYEDLLLRESKSMGFTFKNVGDNHEIVTIQKVFNKKHGELTRLIVENPNDNSFSFYLFSNNKLVKNTNPKFPYFTPESFKYYSQEELKDFEPIINKYFSLFNEKLTDYENYVVNDLRPNKRVPKPPKVKVKVEKKVKPAEAKPVINKSPIIKSIGVFDSETSELIKDSLLLIKKNSDIIHGHSPNKVVNMKKIYGDVEIGGFGLTFKNVNNPDIDRIGIVPLKRDTLKITVYKRDAETPEVFLIHKCDKLISNYNVKSTKLPDTFKYFTQEEIDNSNLNGYMKVLCAKLNDYSEFMSNTENWTSLANLEPVARKYDFVELVQKTINLPTKDKITQEYNDVLSKCFEEFSKTVKGIQEKLDAVLKQKG